ncbi:MAG: Nickel transporter UreH [Myxococcaceae bacterium]|nr:Nickel transporter UreH [Myxococcaceae bacterium]
MLIVLGSLFGQGLLHGVGPDHCLAIGALASRGGLRRALAVSVRFGLGHTAVLGALATATVIAGVVIPARWESALEVVGGASLLALGCWTLLSGVPSDATHHHGDGVMHAHDLTEHGPRASAVAVKGPFPLLAGALFGLSGVRSLVLALPLMAQHDPAVLVAGVLLFGFGVLLSMVLVGYLTQRVATAARRVERGLRALVGLSSMACGAWWVIDHIG